MRTHTCINQDWNFRHSQTGTEEMVCIPHTWNSLDGQDGGNDYYRGTCVYTKSIKKPELLPGGRAYLEFRGVNAVAEVKVNGNRVAYHEGGYSTFRADITDVLEDTNKIEVFADNSPSDKVYPQKADFTFYGGMYRDVYLITVPESHFDLDYHGSSGLMITPVIKGKDAEVTVKTFVKGTYDNVRFTIEGIASGTVTTSETVLTIPDVHLWNGVEDPFLYQVKAELLAEGKVVDLVETEFGCREYTFDPEKGFFLNGRSYPLHGVSRHQDRKGVGNALTKEMQEEDMELMLEMGANAVRLAHYQHDQYFYDLCDQKGMIVWAEIPYISKHMPDANDNTISQMQELIVQNYNHPSIICWALSNEITVSGISEDLIENHRKLNDLVHRLDPTRVTAMAHLFMLEGDSPLLDIPDISSYNLYFGWYVGDLEENDEFFDEYHEKYPNRIVGLSEYGADTHYVLQSGNPQKGDYSEQYQGIYHEHMLNMFAKRPYLWSTFVWNMFDFGADGREEAEDNGVNHKGLVSFDRKVKKDAFYIYKAWWSKEPFLHLCGSRYVDRVESITEVKVYSNQKNIALYKDGELIGEQQGNHVFLFQVPIEGTHEIKAISGTLEDRIEIKKVETENPNYKLKNSKVKNWFEEPGMEIIPGYFSIKDRISEISQVPEGEKLIAALMEQALSSFGDVAKNTQSNPSDNRRASKTTVESIIQMGGTFIPEEMVISINKQLNKIKKP